MNQWFTVLPLIMVAILVSVGLYTVLFKRNLIKMIMGVAIIQNGVNLFLVSLAYRDGYAAPIWTSVPDADMVLPTPHALTLTSIVIGVATTALMLSFVIMLKRHNGTIDSHENRRCRE
ncbi:MAG: cation:proton antiporter subunit C [Thermoplasmata archaeon]